MATRIQKNCGTSSGGAVGLADHVAGPHRLRADVAQQVVAARVEGRAELRGRRARPGGCRAARARRAAQGGVARRPAPWNASTSSRVDGFAEDLLVQRLDQQPGGDGVEGRVVLDVLQGDLDNGLVELLGGDLVEQRDLELGAELGGAGDLVVEAGAASSMDRAIS